MMIALLLLAQAALPSDVQLKPGEDRTFLAPEVVFRATSSAPAVLSVTAEGRRLRLEPNAIGSADVSVVYIGGQAATVKVTVVSAQQAESEGGLFGRLRAAGDNLSQGLNSAVHGSPGAPERQTAASPGVAQPPVQDKPLAQAAAPQPKKASGLLAVLELRSKLSKDDGRTLDVAFITDLVRTAALQSGLKVMTRENIQVLLQAAGKKLEDCEGECEVDTGRRLGADYVATGEVLRFGSKLVVNLKLHETQNGQLLGGSQAMGKTVDDLGDAVQPAVGRLLEPLRK